MNTDLIDEIWNDLQEYQSSLVDNSKKIIQQINNCTICNSNFNTFITTCGAMTCVNCGLVQEINVISDEPDWNNYVEDGVMNSGNIRCGNTLDRTNPYDTGNTFIPKFMWSSHYDADGVKRYTNLSKLAIRCSYSSKQRAFDEGKYSFERIQSN